MYYLSCNRAQDVEFNLTPQKNLLIPNLVQAAIMVVKKNKKLYLFSQSVSSYLSYSVKKFYLVWSIFIMEIFSIYILAKIQIPKCKLNHYKKQIPV